MAPILTGDEPRRRRRVLGSRHPCCASPEEEALDPFGLDDTAALRLSDDQALQRRLDTLNRRRLPPVLWIAAIAFLVGVLNASEDWRANAWEFPAAGLLVSLLALLALRRLLPVTNLEQRAPLRHPALAARFGQLLQAILLLVYLLTLGWAITAGARPLPLFSFAVGLLLFRLLPSELLLLHGLVLVTGGVLWWVNAPDEAIPVLLGSVPL
ncbi:MAG TPA: hypothetical protein VGV61_05935, partial [Thermoanaerobaculia bacterium]|nr:hypothetical protein [Thermoanaerobaculia bacterium]